MTKVTQAGVASHFSPDYPWQERFFCLDTVDSTNNRLKFLAREGAPLGTVLHAEQQTGGRGRLGRSFLSPPGAGIYMSALLRPEAPPEKLMHLTCAAAVAVAEALESTANIPVGIKWTNDIVSGKRKLCGILTELGLSEEGKTDYAIVGIGINCLQRSEDFPPELRGTAGSVAMLTELPPDRELLIAAVCQSVAKMDRELLTNKASILERYRSRCITLGLEISVVKGSEIRHGKALDIDDDGRLVVMFSDGKLETVSSGEVSVRGMYGYV